MKILIAEDDAISALVLRKALEKMMHHVTVVGDGSEAWQLLQSEPFRLVISDWMMPQTDGPTLCRQIRARSGQPHVYFILLTVKGNAEDRTLALEAGVDDFLVKPLDIAELVSRIDVAQRMLKMHDELTINSDQLESLSGELRERNSQLGYLLVIGGVVTQAQLDQALKEQTGTQKRLGEILMSHGWATEDQIVQARSVQMDVPYVDVREEGPDQFVLALVPFEIAEKHQVLPLSVQEGLDGVSGRLRLAMTNPWDIEAIDLIQRLTRRRAEPLLASATALKSAIRNAYQEVQNGDAEDSSSLRTATVDMASVEESIEEMDTAELMRQSDQAPVVRFVNTLFLDAVQRRASDIHIEPQKGSFQILYRIDGLLRTIRSVPKQFLAPTTSRIKIMADMDIAERRLPLDGRLGLRLDGKAVDMRISTLPTQYGERVVLRILDRNGESLSLDRLGFSDQNLQAFNYLINKPHGLILVTGPTGSGKTTTLYAALNALKSSGGNAGKVKKNIITCEDPIEYELDGISQSNVNERAGLTFARQLRAILRQDPDVVLVGEIRDAETAEIALRAALTGHLVLSTLHCNEAAGAVSRLLDMGVPSYLIASTLVGAVAQRLVQCLCPHCRRESTPDREALFLPPTMKLPAKIYEPVGCHHCGGLGSKGRSGVHEVLVVDRSIRKLIMEQAETKTIRDAAMRGGMRTMLSDGLEKVGQGVTTLDDVQTKVSLVGDDETPTFEASSQELTVMAN